jgi:hypothetical protein
MVVIQVPLEAVLRQIVRSCLNIGSDPGFAAKRVAPPKRPEQAFSGSIQLLL